MPFTGTIVISQNPVTDWERYSRTLGRSVDKGSIGYRNLGVEERAEGGYYRCRFRLYGSREFLSEFLVDGLSRQIEVFHPDGRKKWEGLVYEMKLETGTATMRTSLDDLANKVWARYRITGAGVTSRSNVMEDTASQNRYSIKEFILGCGELEAAAVADQVAQQYLDLHRNPTPAPTALKVGKGLIDEPYIEIEGRGFIDTLLWRVWNNTGAAANQGASAQIDDIIGERESVEIGYPTVWDQTADVEEGDLSDFDNYYAGLKHELISYWKLDEVGGNRADSHGTNTLTDNNTVTSRAGVINLAAEFDDALFEYLSHVDNADLSFGDDPFTFSVWAYLDDVVNTYVIFSKWDTAGLSREYTLVYNQPINRFTWIVSNNGVAAAQVNANTFGAVAAGAWYFITVWHDPVANQIGISVNAGAADTLAHATGCFDGTAPFRIGAYTNPAIYFDGAIDEVGVWDRVLTAADRTKLFNGGAGLSYDDFALLDVTVGAARVGNFGIEIEAKSTDVLWAELSGPTNETEITVEAWLDPNALSMANGDAFSFIQCTGSGAIATSASVNLERFGGQYKFSLSVYDDSSVLLTTDSITIDDKWYLVRIVLKVSTGAGNDDGRAYLFINNGKVASIEGIDNDGYDVDSIYACVPLGLDASTTGIFYMDDLRWSDDVVIATTSESGVAQFVAQSELRTNSTLVSKIYDADRKAGDIVADIARLGDANYKRWLVYMTDGRTFVYDQAAPAERG